MLFVVERRDFVKRMDIVRDDRSRRRRRSEVDPTPYFRLAATSDNRVTISGLGAEASFNATVYEAGVLFLRAAMFRKGLAMLPDSPMVTIQANAELVAFGDTSFPMDGGDFLLYPDPITAPRFHPRDRLRAQEVVDAQAAEASELLPGFADAVPQNAPDPSCPAASSSDLASAADDPQRLLMDLVKDQLQRRRQSRD
jgi:hypothetical protein